MITSPKTPVGFDHTAEPIPDGVIGYMIVSNRARAFSAVKREQKRRQVSNATIARRLNKGTDVVSRWLSGPRNWEIDTYGLLMFAITGGDATFGFEQPPAPAVSQTAQPASVPVRPSRGVRRAGGR